VEIEDALRRCGGAARWSRLRALGVPERSLPAALSAGAVELGRGGAYSLPGTDPALVAAVDLRGVVSHRSAALLHGLDLYPKPKLIDVTVARGSRQRRLGVRVHACHLRPQDVEDVLPLTTVRRTLADCGRALPIVQAVEILDSAVRKSFIAPDELRAMARAAKGSGTAAFRQAVAYVDELADSSLESRLRMYVHLLSNDVQSQVYIEGVGWVDFVLDRWLAIEGDGFEHHHDRSSYRKDRIRSNAVVVDGYVLLRFTWEDVFLRPEYVLRTVLEVYSRGPRRQMLHVVT
jgi:very-short-patch-repair endonuclease